jgi:hypothetical protein
MFVVVVAAKVLTLVGIFALILGLVLTVTGMPTAWLAWSGASLSVTAFLSLLLLARRMTPTLETAWPRRALRPFTCPC